MRVSFLPQLKQSSSRSDLHEPSGALVSLIWSDIYTNRDHDVTPAGQSPQVMWHWTAAPWLAVIGRHSYGHMTDTPILNSTWLDWNQLCNAAVGPRTF